MQDRALGQGGAQPPAKSPLPGQSAPPQVTTPALPKLPVRPPTITAPAPQVNLPKVELPN